jgi:hypothetical protein
VNAEAAAKPSIRSRAIDELKEYAVLSIYLYICFTALLFMKAAILRAQGVPFAPFELALVKAQICAKFMSVGHTLRMGERFKNRALIWPTLYRSLVFVALLLVLNVLEEIAVGLIHHRTMLESISDIAGGAIEQLIATTVVMLLILVPLFAFRTLGEAVGERNLVRVFFYPRHGGRQAR